MVDSLNFTDIDKMLGVIIGLGKGVILCSALLIFLKNHPVLNIDKTINDSLIYPFIEKVFIAVLSLFPQNIREVVMKVFGIT